MLAQFFTQTQNRRLVKNYGALVSIQVLNYLLPLITFPYLIRVLGFEKFGMIGFAQAVMVYFTVLCDYGFNLTGNKAVSIHREDKQKLSEIVSSIFMIKAGLWVAGLLILTVLILSVHRFNSNPVFFYGFYLAVAGNAFFPVWFFQGMERMGLITLINFFAKALSTALIFLVIKQPGDFIYVPLIQASGFLLSALLSLVLLYAMFGVRFYLPTRKKINTDLKEGWSPLISNFFVSLYTSTNVLILSFFAGNTIIGYYTLTDKVITAITSFLGNPINQAVYPYLSRRYVESRDVLRRQVMKLRKLLLTLHISIAVAIIAFAPWVIQLLTGEIQEPLVLLLRVLAVGLVVAPFGAHFTQLTIILGVHHHLRTSMLYAVALNFILILPMLYLFDFYGLALTTVFVQVVLISLLYYRTKALV
jgi:PST family polysaccharide transporter